MEEAVILTADWASFELRREGRRGVWELEGDCAKSFTWVAELSDNGREGIGGSGGIEELIAAIKGLTQGG